MNIQEKALEHFGKELITSVRDETIWDIEAMITGQLNGDTAVKVREKLVKFSASQREIVMWFVKEAVDSALHQLLLALEQSDTIKVSVEVQGSRVPDIKTASGGLSGELYSDEGWIARFSKYAVEI